MHFAVDEPVGVVLADFFDDRMDFVEVGVFATRAVGGVGKHGDFRLSIGVCFKRKSGVFDDGVELVLAGLLINATVGKGEDLVAFLANEATGKILRLERNVIFESNENIARGIIKTGNHGIYLAGLDKCGCGIEIWGVDKFYI